MITALMIAAWSYTLRDVKNGDSTEGLSGFIFLINLISTITADVCISRLLISLAF